MITINSTFIKLGIDEESKTLLIQWKPNSVEMSDSDYQIALSSILEYTSKYQLTQSILDASNLQYMIVVQLHEWHNHVFIPQYVASGINKIGVILPEDYMVKLSIEMTFGDELASENLKVEFFENLKMAKQWLMPSMAKTQLFA